jgi:replicative DNA helicase
MSEVSTQVSTANARDGFIPEIEQQLLGALLAGGDHAKVFPLLHSVNFVEPVHGEVYALILKARETYGSTTYPVVARLIPPDLANGFKLSTGMELAAYLARCFADTLLSPATSIKGARAVLEQWARITAGREASVLAELALDPGTRPLDLMRAAGRAFDDIGAQLRAGSRGRTQLGFAEAAEGALAAARDARNRGGLIGITTGLVDLDRLLGGLQRRDLILVAARPSMGKTTLGTTLARAAAESGIGVGFMSLEMDAQKLGARMIADIAHQRGLRVVYQDIITGTAAEADLAALDMVVGDYRSLPLRIEDQSGLTMSEIRAKAEGMIEKAEAAGTPLGVLVVDHLGKIRPSSRYQGNRANEVGEITDDLKALAREYGIAVVLLSQLNRGVESRDDKRPQLMDLRDSGAIEQDADAVLFMYRPAYYLERAKPEGASMDKLADWHAAMDVERHRLEVSIAKQRNGPIATVDLYVDVACSAIRNAALTGQYREAA